MSATRQPDGSVLIETQVMGRRPTPDERAALNEAVGSMAALFNALPNEMWPSLLGSMFTTVAMAHDDPLLTGQILSRVCRLSLMVAVNDAAGHG